MPQAAENNIKNAGQFATATLSNFAEIIEALLEFLEREAQLAPQKELAKWIRKGGALVSYPIQGHCKDELKYEMEKNGVAYVETTTGYLIIPAPQLDRVRELNRQILVGKCNYFQEVDAIEMENAIAKFDRIQNKDIFTICGLDKYESEVLKNKCNNISAGFMVGIKNYKDGTCDLSVHGERIYNPDANKDFCKAYLQMAFSLYGPNSNIKRAQIEADEITDEKVRALKDSPNVHYVIGADDNDPKHYIEINSNGFEFYESYIVEGNRHNSQLCRIDKDNPNYESELERYMDRILNKVVLDNENDLGKHLWTNERNMDCDRPLPDKKALNVSMASDKITDTIDKMIKNNIKENETQFSDVNQAFTYYQREAANIMNCIEKDTIPKGYKIEDIDNIKKTCEKYGVKISDFSKSKEMLTAKKGEVHKATYRNPSKETDQGER